MKRTKSEREIMVAECPIWGDLYWITSAGDVLSLARHRVKVKQKDKNGYYSVGLCRDKKQKRVRVGRMVAWAFIRPPRFGEQVNHIDGNKSNDDVDNLEWVTPQENTIHAWENGFCTKRFGEDVHTSRLTEDMVRDIHKRVKNDERRIDIARDLGIDVSNISYIVSGKTWPHIYKEFNAQE